MSVNNKVTLKGTIKYKTTGTTSKGNAYIIAKLLTDEEVPKYIPIKAFGKLAEALTNMDEAYIEGEIGMSENKKLSERVSEKIYELHVLVDKVVNVCEKPQEQTENDYEDTYKAFADALDSFEVK